VIRSWDFDLLVIVLFSKDGNILRAIELNVDIAESLSKENRHQNGYILTTTKELLENEHVIDLTIQFQNILDGKSVEYNTTENTSKPVEPPVPPNYDDLTIIRAYLVQGFSYRHIEREIMGPDAPARGRGFGTMKILQNFGIDGKKKGVLRRHTIDEEIQYARGIYRATLMRYRDNLLLEK
jgi:hypothetical protein